MATRKISQGTAIVWGQPGAAGITHNLTFSGLAAAAAREGVKADLGASWDDDYAVQLIWETGTAPTAGGVVELWLACSRDNSTWPADVTGADAAWAVTEKANLRILVGAIVVPNTANKTVALNLGIWRPPTRYVTPVVVNNTSQACRVTDPASNNTSRVILVPRVETIA